MTSTVAPAVLTIAGSDSSGGAGIQADLKTYAAFGVFGASAITAITAQNTHGVRGIHLVPLEMLSLQIDAVLDDVPIHAIKIGMVGSRAVAATIAASLARHAPRPVVLDPVLIATSGDRLGDTDTPAALIEHLVPVAACLTPNLDEAAILTAMPLARSEADMLVQGRRLLELGARAVVMKGGHLEGAVCTDLLVTPERVWTYRSPRLDATNTHGTGCTLSSAIAASLALGRALPEAVGQAKAFVSLAMARAATLHLGKGRGPLWHAITPPSAIEPT